MSYRAFQRILSWAAVICLVLVFSCGRAIAGPLRLIWDPSPDYGITRYNVYRAVVSGGPYAKLTKEPVLECGYTDQTATPGNRYFYVVTAVDTAGNEGSFSPEFAAMVAAYDFSPEPGALLASTNMDLTVASGDLVLLSGCHRDPEGKSVSYKWTQLSGKSVAISGMDRPEAAFLAPIVSVDTVLMFALTATDSAGGGTSDFIIVTVRRR